MMIKKPPTIMITDFSLVGSCSYWDLKYVAR